MAEKDALKLDGLAFGHSLLIALKSAGMYSVDHPMAEKGLRKTFAGLVALVKQTQRFSIGFLNQRVLVNTLLCDDKSLVPLEVEFSRRGIAVISFSAGITFHEFKRALAVLSAKPQVIEENGGIVAFVEKNQISGVRVIPALGQKEGDTEIGMEMESLWLGPRSRSSSAQPVPGGLEMLLQVAGLDRPAGFAGSAEEIHALASKATLAALQGAETDPQRCVEALARLLDELSPESLLAILTRGNLQGLQGAATREIAAQMAENTAACWAAGQLASTPSGHGARDVEAEVLRVLSRGLRATLVAARLVEKLATMMKDAQLPAEIQERIRQELAWSALSDAEQHAQLRQANRFDAQLFQRLLTYVKEMMRQGKAEKAVEISRHYFATLDATTAAEEAEGLSRAPELLSALAAQHTMNFLGEVAALLGKECQAAGPASRVCHAPAADCLASLAQSAALYEAFDVVYRIALVLQATLAGSPAEHAACCGRALSLLVTPRTAERVVELFLERRDDPHWTKMATALLRSAGRIGCEKVFERLAAEPAASNRMRLMRFFSQLGPAGTEVVRRGLRDSRWYVVRNACYLAGDFAEPEILHDLSSALRHTDIRVQQAAVTAILKSRLPGRAQVLARVLPYLKERTLEMTLEELAYLQDPAALPGLEEFLGLQTVSRANLVEKVIRAMAAVPSEAGVEALSRVLYDTSQPQATRRLAMAALARSPFALARRRLDEFAASSPRDPLAAECRSPQPTTVS